MLIIKKIGIEQAGELLNISRKTFFDFFGPLNEKANMDSYAAVAFTPQKIREEILNINSDFYFALYEYNIAGYLKLNFNEAQTEFQDNRAMEVERIYVLDEYKGKKIGGGLLNFALNVAIKKQLEYVWLGVWEHNHPALGFYRHNGFEIFSRHQFLLGTDVQTDLLMRKFI